jgi:DNA modification methylase
MGLPMTLLVADPDFRLYLGDVREVLAELPDESVHCVVTSPPYWGLRDYAVEGQLGLEPTPDQYIHNMVAVFREVRRVLRRDGTCWLNIGDSYTSTAWGGSVHGTGGATEKQATNIGSFHESRARTGLKPKDLCGIPWRLAFALQQDGWYLRAEIIWAKPNPMPESVTDRPTKAHEQVFLLTRSPRYFYDAGAVREPPAESVIARSAYKVGGVKRDASRNDHDQGERCSFSDFLAGRNLRSVWEIPTEPFPQAHFATYPQALVERCVKAGCPEDGTVLDPFIGSGTTALVARRLGRKCIGIELSPEYAQICLDRTRQLSLLAT